MCLLLVAHDCDPEYRLVVVANRDEFHARPTAAAAWWDDQPGILAGRDLESGGTWLGQHVNGRFATVTNVRSGDRVRRGARSRGLIVSDFLNAATSAARFNAELATSAHDYDGYNLLAYDGRDLNWYSNQTTAPRALTPGVYTLSNAALDTSWPKTERLRAGFARVMASASGAAYNETIHNPTAALLGLLRDAAPANDSDLPNTGVGPELERVLSSIFIDGVTYGTRCSSVVLIRRDGKARLHERRYGANGAVSGDSEFKFVLSP